MNRLIVSSLCFIMLGISAYAQESIRSYLTDDKLIPREHNVDMQHMLLELDFVPEQALVKGKVKHTFITLQQEVSSLFLDAPDIRIKNVLMDDVEVQFEMNQFGVNIIFPALSWGSQHTVEITYEANPKKGLYFVGWNDPNNLSRKQIWSQGQGIDNRHWIPFYDEMNDKLTTEMVVTFDSNYKVLSNGTKLKSKENKDGTTTWHYKMQHPHAPYLVMLGVGKYGIKESKSKSGVPMYFWYYPELEHHVEWMYKYSEDMMDYFEEMIGVKYPWESYSQIPVQEFMYGAMENTTATIFGDFYHIDARGYLDKNYVNTNAHELAHQWFGDLVTARSSAHHWLQESFATYYNMLYEQRVFGDDHYDWERRLATNNSLKQSEIDFKPIGHSEAGVTRHYPKGAHVLHMLKYVVGEEQYNAAIKHYLEKHAYGNVDSEDLLVAFHERLGLSLDWFWEQWVYRGGEPEYKVTYREALINGVKKTLFTVDQIHLTNDVVTLFKMPIDFEVHYTDGTMDSKRVWIEDKHHEISVDNEDKKEIAFVLFDPNSEVMKKITFIKSNEMLKNQALNAPKMIDRYDAMVALRTVNLADKRTLLSEAFEKESHHYIKIEILDQLMFDAHPKTLGVVSMGIQDSDPLVRLKSLDGLSQGLTPLVEEYEKLLQDSSYNVVIKALEQLSMAMPDNVQRYLDITKNEVGVVGKNVRIKWLEIACSIKTDKSLLKELVQYTSQSYEFKTRVNAANALKTLNYIDNEVIANLMNAIESPNKRLAGPCGKVLTYFYDQRTNKVLIKNYLNQHAVSNELMVKVKEYLN